MSEETERPWQWWIKEENSECIVARSYGDLAAFLNSDGDVVLKQRDQYDDDDAIIVVQRHHIKALVAKLADLQKTVEEAGKPAAAQSTLNLMRAAE